MNKSGDIIITRNAEEIGNPTPGYWNHAAISAGVYIIEAQEKPDEVIATDISVFRLRYPEFMVIRYVNAEIAYRAAQVAYNLIGKPYRKYASIFFWRRTNLGENCVSVVRKAWSEALKKNIKWRTPDEIYATTLVKSSGFTIIEHHKDYKNWVKQPNFGRIN